MVGRVLVARVATFLGRVSLPTDADQDGSSRILNRPEEDASFSWNRSSLMDGWKKPEKALQ